MAFITISEELNYQFVLSVSSSFFKVMYCIYRINYFNLIVGSSSVNDISRECMPH